MKRIVTIVSALLVLAACQDELPVSAPGGNVEGMREIVLQQPATQQIETRAESDRDDRVENVILFAFDGEGNLLNTPVQQPVSDGGQSADGKKQYKVRIYLPGSTTRLYAVCNYDEPEELTDKEMTWAELQTYKLPAIQNLEDAFKGVYVMEGAQTNIQAGEDVSITIPVQRLASKQSFQIIVDPRKENEQFLLSSIRVYNIPKTSFLMDQAADVVGGQPEAHSYQYHWWTPAAGEAYEDADSPYQSSDQLGDWTGDAVYDSDQGTRTALYLSPTGEEGTELSFDSTKVSIQTPSNETVERKAYNTSFSLFENRRGGVTAQAMNAALGITDRNDEEQAKVRQIYKKGLVQTGNLEVGSLHQDYYQYASYIVIEGAYETAKVRYHVQYYVYLGCNNYGDFNVVRNHHYNYTVTIRACDDVDTRVTAEPIGDPTLLTSAAPFDTFFNVREAVLSSPGDWEVYVKDPDKTPWLEISTSPTYYAHTVGGAATPGENLQASDYASFRLEGGQGLHYLYIHTDEYVPKIEETTSGGEQATFANDVCKPRTGTICYGRRGGQMFEYTVTQYPAQLVEIEVWNIPEAKNEKHRFYTSRFPEEKYLTWGFESYWNQTLDLLITQGLYDGLSTTRKEYISALYGDVDSESRKRRIESGDLLPIAEKEDLPGRQNACYWPDADSEADGWQNDELNARVPTDIALGYALGRNRDRNNSGHIDYNEILWYLPSVEQMEGIYEAMHPENGAPNLFGNYVITQNEQGEIISEEYVPLSLNGKFWSATPSVSDAGGITPGRAYLWDMGSGKYDLGLRDQAFKVIVCRNADGWTGPETGNGQGGVNVDTDWDEDEEHNTPRGDSK